MDTFLTTLFILVCVLLIIVVLLQKGRGGGLGSAFGGLGSSAFGTRVGDVLTWVTIILTAVFLLLAVLTSMQFRPKTGIVATPQFSPPSGKYTDNVYVSIYCDTAKAKIYYTLDGSEPTETSDEYTGMVNLPIAGTEGVTIKARAFKPAWNPSDTASSYYGPNWKASTQPAEEPAAAPPATQPISTRPATTGPATR
ncbi:MAG: preprotein translocase subunit SecG [Planctomycetaceae bacterium]|nr:preprotein translocase subunit SecG [Planctomycetaceae bacterium]